MTPCGLRNGVSPPPPSPLPVFSHAARPVLLDGSRLGTHLHTTVPPWPTMPCADLHPDGLHAVRRAAVLQEVAHGPGRRAGDATSLVAATSSHVMRCDRPCPIRAFACKCPTARPTAYAGAGGLLRQPGCGIFACPVMQLGPCPLHAFACNWPWPLAVQADYGNLPMFAPLAQLMTVLDQKYSTAQDGGPAWADAGRPRRPQAAGQGGGRGGMAWLRGPCCAPTRQPPFPMHAWGGGVRAHACLRGKPMQAALFLFLPLPSLASPRVASYLSSACRHGTAGAARSPSAWQARKSGTQPNRCCRPPAKRASHRTCAAGAICPWALHLFYGDTRTLRRAYPMMRAYVDFCVARCRPELRAPEVRYGTVRGNGGGAASHGRQETAHCAQACAFHAIAQPLAW